MTKPKIEEAENSKEKFILKEDTTYTFFSSIESTGKGYWILKDKKGNEKTRVVSLEDFDKKQAKKFRSIQFEGDF